MNLCSFNIENYDEIDRGFYDLGETTTDLTKKINLELKTGYEIEKLKKFYNDTKTTLNQTTQRLSEYQEKAEGYIALSQYREEQKQDEDLAKGVSKFAKGQDSNSDNSQILNDDILKTLSVKQVPHLNGNHINQDLEMINV